MLPVAKCWTTFWRVPPNTLRNFSSHASSFFTPMKYTRRGSRHVRNSQRPQQRNATIRGGLHCEKTAVSSRYLRHSKYYSVKKKCCWFQMWTTWESNSALQWVCSWENKSFAAESQLKILMLDAGITTTPPENVEKEKHDPNPHFWVQNVSFWGW